MLMIPMLMTACVMNARSPLAPATRPGFEAQTAPNPQPQLGTPGEVFLSELARSSLFKLTIAYEPDSVTGVPPTAKRVQPGFMIGGDGLGVTSYSALHQATRIEASFSGKQGAWHCDVVGADPGRDLAVIHLTAASAANAALPAMPIDANASTSERTPQTIRLGGTLRPFDERCWTLFLDAADGAVRALDEAELVARVGTNEQTVAGGESVVLVKSPIDRKLGGLPLVDVRGCLVGAWRWVGPSPLPQTIDAQSIASLVATCKSSEHLSHEARVKRFGSLHARSFTFPILDWTGSSSSDSASEAIKRAQEFKAKILCDKCNGRGETTEKEIRFVGRDLKKKETDTTTKCAKCGGDRLADPKHLWTAVRVLASKAACVPPSSSQQDDVLRALEAAIASAVAVNPNVLVKRINDSAKEELRSANVIPGRAIAFCVPQNVWPEHDAPDWDERVRVIRSPELGSVLLLAPRSRNGSFDGGGALIVGAVAGFITNGDEDTIVMDRCLVVPVKYDKEKPGR